MIPKRFLLIDDDPYNNTLCRITIMKFFPGVPIVAFTDPEKAIEYIAEEYSKNPVNTVLFLDINMPGLDGWEILDKLNELPFCIKDYMMTFLLSAIVRPIHAHRAMDNYLISGFLEKPLNKKRLQSLFANEFVTF